MQLHLHRIWSFAETHEDAHWGEAFPVQPMQQSLHTKKHSCKTFQNSHDLEQNVETILKSRTGKKTRLALVL